MYRILIVSQETGILDAMNANLDWVGMNFYQPLFAENYEDAINTIENQRIDCIGYLLEAEEARKLNQYLTNVRPSLPVFQVKRTLRGQIDSMREVRHVLDRLMADTADEILEPETVLEMLREEFVHELLEGRIRENGLIDSRLLMLRSSVAADKPCVVIDFELPQGEVYLGNRWHYGSERLENALRNNFFGKYYNDIYYTVAVLTPCHIRMLACQRTDKEPVGQETLLNSVSRHVQEVLENIKSYLNLDMEPVDCRIFNDVYSLAAEVEGEL